MYVLSELLVSHVWFNCTFLNVDFSPLCPFKGILKLQPKGCIVTLVTLVDFLNANSNCLPEMMQSHTFLAHVSPNVPSHFLESENLLSLFYRSMAIAEEALQM